MIRRSLVDWTQDGPLPGGHAQATRNPRPTKKVEIMLDTTGNPLAAVTIPTFDADLNEIKSEHYDYTSVSLSTAQTGAISAFTAGTLIRTEETTYLVNDTSYSQAIRDAYRARNMLGLPTKKIVKNTAGLIVAATEFVYDEYSAPKYPNYTALPLLTYANPVTGYTDPATIYRGNVTTTRNWNNNGNQTWVEWTSGTWIEVHAQYDQFGSPRKSWDGKGNLAQVEYTDSFSDGVNRNTYAYPTTTISPIPDTAGTYGTNTTLNVQTKYDFSSGKVTWVQDANNQVATTEYEAPYPPVVNNCCNSLNRLKRVVSPAGGGETTYEYNDATSNMWVKTRKLRAAGVWLESVTYLDKIGRAWLSASNEGGNLWSVSETKYDNQGRAYQGSNPYRVTATSADNVPAAAAAYTTKVWTTSTFDALNRVLTLTTPDNAVVATNYNGNQVTVTDQAGKQRRSESDAMGRLLKIWEAPNNENYLTTYKYDALDNLVQVTQGAQNRYFLYDSVKRLVRARNPEQKIHINHDLTDPFSNTTNTQWSLAYTYDANSNLLTKTDSRNATAGQAPVTTTFGYDALNRNTTVGYSVYQNGSAYVERHYDTATLGKGKFHWNAKYNTESDGTYAYNYDFINGYDAVGRPTSKTQKILYYQGSWLTKDFTTSVTYDLASNVLSQTYPSGRIVNYAYDAAGRTNSFTGNLGGTQRNYATAMQYTAAGLMSKETFGTTTALYHRMNYNVRQQMFGVRVGTYSGTQYDDDPLQAYYNQGSSWDRGMLISHYGSTGATSDFSSWGTSGTNNNGNVLRGHHFIPGGIYVSDYEYDGLNRLKKDTGYGNANYTQAFDYDQWGNRKINQSLTTTSTDINKKDFTVDTATNQLGVPTGQTGAMNYDDVGNLILDTYTSNLTAGMQYDADNKMTSAANGGQQYRYNADGKRVKRIITGTGGGQYWMVYGIGGELVAEYNATSSIPATTSPSKEYGYRGGQMLIVAESSTVVKWLVQDHLGSTRMEIGVGGAIGDVIRHDYLPFGEELAGSMRSAANGYGTATNTKQKFTGYERDDETGLDYAQARMYASVQGRFTSVDPDGVGAVFTEPQSWNGYAYCGNRPTTLTDPSGLLWVMNGAGDLGWYNGSQAQFEAQYGANSGWRVVDGKSISINRSGWVNGIYFQAGSSYTLNSSGSATNNHSNTEIKPIPYITAFHDSDVSLGVVKLWFYSAQIGAGLGSAAYQAGGFTINAIGQVVKEEVKDQAQDLMLSKLSFADPNTCFVAGTPVKTIDGDIPIEEIKAGDIVLSYNVESGELEYKQVTRTYLRASDDLFDLSIQGEEKAFRVTANHPFLARSGCPSIVTEGQWIRVDELRTGFEVMNPDGNWVRIIKLQRHKGKFKVYNFEVVDNHDYFVGLKGVLVHNDCTDEVKKWIDKNGGTHVRMTSATGAPYVDRPDSLYDNKKLNKTGDVRLDSWGYHDVAVKDGKVFDPYAKKQVQSFSEWWGNFDKRITKIRKLK